VAAAMVAAALWVGPASRLLDIGSRDTVLGIYELLVLGSAALLVADLLRGRWAEDTVTGLVIDLGDSAGTTGLRDRLSRAIGDPTLTVGYWLADEQRFVDESGRPVDVGDPDGAAGADLLAGTGGRRATTPVTVDGAPLAVLVHDSNVLADPGLLADVAAAARFAVANAALQAQVRAKVAGVEASRRRLVTAADEERCRLEERLRDGAGHHLDRVDALLRGADGPLAGLVADAARARASLHDLGLGLYPRSLAEGDLPTPPIRGCRLRWRRRHTSCALRGSPTSRSTPERSGWTSWSASAAACSSSPWSTTVSAGPTRPPDPGCVGSPTGPRPSPAV
jgi:hypothetical protein